MFKRKSTPGAEEIERLQKQVNEYVLADKEETDEGHIRDFLVTVARQAITKRIPLCLHKQGACMVLGATANVMHLMTVNAAAQAAEQLFGQAATLTAPGTETVN